MNFRLHCPRLHCRFVALATSALLLGGCFWPTDEVEPLAFTLPSTTSNVPLAVGTARYTVAQGEVVRTVALNGVVQAGTQRELYFTVEGPITQLYVGNGDPVLPGDLLMELDAEDAALNLAEAELQYRQAELRLEQAKTGDSYAVEVARLNLEIAELQLEKLQWDPTASRDQIEVAQRQVELARTALEQAENGATTEDSVDVPIAEVQLQIAELNRKRAQRQLDNLQLYAPITGTVRLGQELRVGFPVEAYAPLVRIVDPASLVVESNAAAAELASLSEGMPVQMELNFLPGVLFPGTITSLPQPYGNSSSPLTQIVPDLTGLNLTLREGAAVSVRAEVGRREHVLWLPNRVVQTVAGRTYVVVREDEQLRDQAVVIGLVGDERTEIVEGLSLGMEVVGP